MDTTPTPAKRRSWSAATSFERARRMPLGRRNSMRQTPRRSSAAVETIRTRESGSSTQSTGTSPMRRPRRSAVTSSSVSKNHSLSSTSGSSFSAASRRRALKPHWASLKRPCSVSLSNRL